MFESLKEKSRKILPAGIIFLVLLGIAKCSYDGWVEDAEAERKENERAEEQRVEFAQAEEECKKNGKWFFCTADTGKRRAWLQEYIESLCPPAISPEGHPQLQAAMRCRNEYLSEYHRYRKLNNGWLLVEGGLLLDSGAEAEAAEREAEARFGVAGDADTPSGLSERLNRVINEVGAEPTAKVKPVEQEARAEEDPSFPEWLADLFELGAETPDEMEEADKLLEQMGYDPYYWPEKDAN